MKVSNLNLSYWNKAILKNINLDIKKWEFVFFIWFSWSWKTSMIKSLIWDLKPSSWEIILDDGMNLYWSNDKYLTNYRRKIWIIFQDYKLLESKTVYENVAFAMEVSWYSDKHIINRVPEVLSQVWLLIKKNNYINELSWWEKQRIAIARALVHNPEMIIWDEPTWNLDPVTSLEIMEIFKELNDEWITVILATHDKNIVNKYKKRVITFSDKEIILDEENWKYSL